MLREIVSCPYCNSSVTLSAPGQIGDRVHCPRCEESFPYRPGERVEDAAGEPATAGIASQAHSSQRWSNSALALAMVAGMAALAIISLTFAELTTPIRRGHDTTLPGRRSFTIPVVVFSGMFVYVTVLGLYVIRLLRRRDRPLSRPGRIAATAFLAVLIVIGLADVYGMVRRWSGPSGESAPTSPTSASESAPVAAVAPAQLAGLAYLPSDTNVLLGLHVAEALEHPLGQEILKRWAAGPGDATLPAMVRWTGLELADVDHAIVSLKVDDRLLPRFRVVVRTRQAYDGDKLRAALKTGRPALRLEKTVCRFVVPQTPLEAVLWCADERTLVFALSPEDLDDVPPQPGEGVERLAAPLQQALARIALGSPFWFAGHSRDWTNSLLGTSILYLPKEDRPLLKEIRTVAASLHLANDASFRLAIECADLAAAKSVSKSLQAHGVEGGKPLPFLAARPEMKSIAAELSRSLRRSQDKEWILIEATATADSVRQALGAVP